MSIAAGVRPYFQQLGVAIFGPNPKEEAHRVREERVGELQLVVNQASDFESLASSKAFQAWQVIAQEELKNLNRQLRAAKANEFAVIQAKLQAYDDAVNIVPNMIARGQVARDEIERLRSAE